MNNNTVIVYVNDFSNGNVTVDAARLCEYFNKACEMSIENGNCTEIEFCTIKPSEVSNMASYENAVKQTVNILEEALKNA
nr:MAG TPA: hypothetical protein [Bacteriophage sp.]